MSYTYAIGDIHGRFDLLQKAIAAIALHAGNAPHEIVLLGDYIDRGPQSAEVVEYLMAHPSWICLAGNHDLMMVETFRNPAMLNLWLENGGGQTLRSYGQLPGERPISVEALHRWLAETIPQAHIDWIAGLPWTHVDDYRVFVHAGIDAAYPLDMQPEWSATWMLFGEFDPGPLEDRVLVHGHHQHEDGPLIVHNRYNVHAAGRIAIDTGAYYTGRLVVVVFDDDHPFPVDMLEINDGE